MASRYGTCEAKLADEFPGCKTGGTITQIEVLGSDCQVMGWFLDRAVAEAVCALLNKHYKKTGGLGHAR